LLFEIVHTKWDEVESDDEDEPVGICSTTPTTSTNQQVSTLKQGEDQKSEDVVPLQGLVRPVTHTGQTGADRGTPTCLMAKKEKKSKKKRQAKGAKGQKIEASSSPTRELELLKSELASLVCKYESLANKYDHDIKSFSYRAKVEEEANDELEAQLEKLTSEHMALQADHKGLECSYEKLVDSYATLETDHEVMLSSVKSIQPPSHTCTCSQVQINLSCANDCLSQASQSSIEHILVESCDDLVAKENDELKQEVEKLQKNLYALKEKSKVQPSQDNREDMVKKLEKGSTITSSTPPQYTMTHKNKIQEKSKVGKVKSQYRPTKHKAQESFSKKPRSSNKWRVFYKCREKGHFADSCPSVKMGSGSDHDRSNRCMPPVRPVPARPATPQANK
jgi:predicted nuclease with TOPRIM domain